MKMQRAAWMLLVWLATCLGNLLPAAEPHEQWLKFFEGSWTWTASNGWKGELKWGKCGDVPALTGEFLNQTTGKKAFSVMGWEEDTETLVDTGFDSLGAHGRTEYKITGDKTAKGIWTSWSKDQVSKSLFNLTRMDDNKYELKITEATKDGEETELLEITLQRSKAAGQSAGEKAFQAYADLVAGGTWIANIDGHKFEDTYELILGGKFLKLTSKAAGEFPAAVVFMGVDPVTGKSSWWGFDTDGAVSTGTNSLVGDGVWEGIQTGKGPKGGMRLNEPFDQSGRQHRQVRDPRAGSNRRCSTVLQSLNLEKKV